MSGRSETQMEAGRELDALVAEHVMGFEWWRSSNSGNRSLFPPGYIPRGPHEWFRKRADGTEPLCFDFPSHVPHYSTDISAAWAVVEKMVSDGHVFIVKGDGLRSGDFSPRWTVYCCNMPRVDSDSAPLAICRAALAAFTGTEGKE